MGKRIKPSSTRQMRCCVCPNEEDSRICHPPKGSDVPATQCNFVLSFLGPFGRTYTVLPYLKLDNTQYYTIFCKSINSKNQYCVPWALIYSSRDSAQEALNKVAIEKKWQPLNMEVVV